MRENQWGSEAFEETDAHGLEALYRGADHSPSIKDRCLRPSHAELQALRRFGPYFPGPGLVSWSDLLDQGTEYLPRFASVEVIAEDKGRATA